MGKSRAVMGGVRALRRRQYHHLPGLSLERTTGFEPATLTLAKKGDWARASYLHVCEFMQHDRRIRLTATDRYRP
jgi:hypothetical protein